MQNKTIRFFISSTFKDFEAERNMLQKLVFPKLKELCNKNGFGFQPIDLRWGIQEEAGLEQQTMNICLHEIKRSTSKPKPNLLILMGQRYGWIPLPYEMKKDEFEIIIESNKILDKDKDLIRNWYEKDENSTENIYYLKNKHHLIREEWNKIEKEIRISFQKVFNNPKDEEIYRKFNTSATEQEMYLGLDKFQKEVDNSHTFAYFRKIINYNNEDVTDYIDKDLTKLKKLWKKLRKNSNIPKKNQNIQRNVQWNEIKQSNNISYNELNLEKSASYLKEFHDEILEKFTISIQKEINNFEEQTRLQIELEQQENFLKEKSEIVLGRDTEVERILTFIKNDDEQFYLQYGKSGSGKTSVMAKAISEINTKEYEVYYRFIGITANSTYSRTLFESIFWEIEANLQNKNDLSKPSIEIEEIKFKEQFKFQLKKLNDKKIVIFLDALDQFEDYNDLTIFLDELPLNIKIVFSTLYDENKKDNSDYSEYFNRLSYLKTKYELLPLSISTNKEILERLLETQNRKLTIKQWKKINSNLQDITPLHLRLIFEIVKHWKSKQDNLFLEDSEEKLIVQFFEFIVEQYHHKKELLELSFGYIAASKDGLSEEELLDLLSNDEEFLKLFQNDRYPNLNRLPNAIWSRFYYYVQNIFTEKLIDGEMLIKPYHRIIEEVIKENFYKNNKNQLHKKLSDYFYLKQDKNKTWNQRYYSLRMLSELPYQLYECKNSELLKEILFDLEFAGSVYDNNKHDSFRDIMSKATQLDNIKEDEIYPWESFYREKEHLILKVNEELWRPHQSLFQLAYEDGENSPLTFQAEKLIKENKIEFKWLKLINRQKNFTRTGLLKVLEGHSGSVNGVKILEEGRILSYSDDKTLRLWDNKGNLLKVLEEHKDFINGTIELNNGKILSWSNYSIILWDKSGQFISIFNEHEGVIVETKKLESELFFSWSDMDGSLHLIFWTQDGEIRKNIKIPNDIFECLEDSKINEIISEFSDPLEILGYIFRNKYKLFNNKIIFARKHYLDVYDTKNNELKSIITRVEGNIENIWTLNNDFIVVFTEDIYGEFRNSFRLLDKDANLIKILRGHEDYINDIKILNDKKILTCSQDRTIRLWDNKGNEILILKNHTESVTGIEIFSNEIFLSYSRDRTIRFWDNDGNLQNTLIAHNDIINGVKVLKDTHVISYSNDHTLKLWNFERNKESECISHKGLINGYIKLNDTQILTYSDDNSLKIWNKNGELLKTLEKHMSPVKEVKLLKDGNFLSFSNAHFYNLHTDDTICLWNESGEFLRNLLSEELYLYEKNYFDTNETTLNEVTNHLLKIDYFHFNNNYYFKIENYNIFFYELC